MRKLLITLTTFLFINLVHAQADNTKFIPSGKPFMTLFTNYHSTFIKNSNYNAFELQRAYFGYAVNFSEKFSGKVSVDVGNPGVGKYQMTANFKNAYIQYRADKLTAKFGLLGLTQFELQEQLWGGRYLFKSFQDEYKFGHSADLGISASYKFNDYFNADVAITNGEGYKSLETDSIFKYSVGLTVSPIKGLDVRAYYDYIGNPTAQQSIAIYAGYKKDNFYIASEYNKQLNHSRNKGEDLSGVSLYSSYKFKKFRLFGRFDQLNSAILTDSLISWNSANDGQAIIAGIEFEPVKGFKFSPNYQAWIPANNSAIKSSIYLSCEIKF